MIQRAERARLVRRDIPGQDEGLLANLGHDPESLERVRPGAYVRAAEWAELFAEGRLRTRAAAVGRRVDMSDAAFGYATAAALWMLPIYRVRWDRVDLIVPGAHSRKNSRDVVRHHVPLSSGDVTTIGGLRTTSLERTVYDVIRCVRLEAAVVCFDAALRLVAWDETSGTYDRASDAEFRDGVLHRIGRHSGARGIRQARLVTAIADGRAQLPGESISRLWMWQLDVPAPELQYRVDFDRRRHALLDFAWPGLRRWAEFDGEAKYTDPALTGGASEESVRAAQSAREARVRRITGWEVDRWGFEVLESVDTFAAHLRAIGLYRP